MSLPQQLQELVWDILETNMLVKIYETMVTAPPLNVCPGCGYGTTASGIVLVTAPELVILHDAPRLCQDCNPARTGRRQTGDPEFFKACNQPI